MQERTVESKQIYEGRRVKLHVDRVVLPGGRETTREVVDHPDCVGSFSRYPPVLSNRVRNP